MRSFTLSFSLTLRRMSAFSTSTLRPIALRRLTMTRVLPDDSMSVSASSGTHRPYTSSMSSSRTPGMFLLTFGSDPCRHSAMHSDRTRVWASMPTSVTVPPDG